VFENDNAKRARIGKWIFEHVENNLYNTAVFKMTNAGKAGPGALVHALRSILSPTLGNAKSDARDQYVEQLAIARRRNIKPEVWYNNWFEALYNAKPFDIPEIQGTYARRELLKALNDACLGDRGAAQSAEGRGPRRKP
jgi:hypothetical protein